MWIFGRNRDDVALPEEMIDLVNVNQAASLDDVQDVISWMDVQRERTARLHLDDMISSRLELEDINDAFDRMRKGEAARQVIVFD